MNSFSQPAPDSPTLAATASATTRRDSEGRPPRFTKVKLFTDNLDAWQAKRELIGRAQHSLDLAYFIVEVDGTTSRLMLDLVAAAQRGVKVRLLADYFLTFNQAPALKTLAAVQNIEVRRYRPPTAAWLRALEAAGIDKVLFAKGLMTTSGPLLANAIKENTIFPVQLLAAVRTLRAEPGESRLAFASRLLTMLRDLVGSDIGRPYLSALAALAVDSVPRMEAKLALLLEVIGGLKEFLRRTHHKLLLADEREFIMGGRNLSDAYQRNDLPPGERSFQDTDVLAFDGRLEGSEHVAAFQALWDCAMSVDVTLPDPVDSGPALEIEILQNKAREVDSLKPAAGAAPAHDLPDMEGYIVNNLPTVAGDDLIAKAQAFLTQQVFARGRPAVVDMPKDAGDASITKVYASLIQEVAARGGPAVIDIVSAYVCFAEDGSAGPSLLELPKSLLAAVRAGVTVNVYTNSIATTDLKPINRAAYPGLLELMDGGVNVFELQGDQGSLHTKAAAFANDWLVVGSYNMDPRSQMFDTNNLIVLRDRGGRATAAFRDTRINGLKWTRLTPESIGQLAAEAGPKSPRFRVVRGLL